MTELQLLMNRVHAFVLRTFPGPRAVPALHHLQKEVKEAIEAIEAGQKEEAIKEYADCFILLLNSASNYGLTADHLIAASNAKMDVNDKRKWGPPDENGVCLHIKSDEEKLGIIKKNLELYESEY